jgi:hypothetical protein
MPDSRGRESGGVRGARTPGVVTGDQLTILSSVESRDNRRAGESKKRNPPQLITARFVLAGLSKVCVGGSLRPGWRERRSFVQGDLSLLHSLSRYR